jgi:tRNA(Ile)-lysidine synthase
LNEDEEFLVSIAKGVAEKAKTDSGYLCSDILNSAVPVMKRALVMIIEENTGVTPEYRSLEALIDILGTDGKIQINGGVTVRVRKGILDFPNEQCGLGGIEIKTEIVNIKEINNLQNISKQHLEYYLDYDKIHGKVFVRSREAGDKITLVSRNCTKSLKKLFNELSVPPEKRESVAVVADDNGLIALEGVGVDRRAAVTAETKNVMVIQIKR